MNVSCYPRRPSIGTWRWSAKKAGLGERGIAIRVAISLLKVSFSGQFG